MSSLQIRLLDIAEYDLWLPLALGYKIFYKTSVSADEFAAAWQRLHDQAIPTYALGAFDAGRLVGIAHYLLHCGCWTVNSYCYLQDLYVDESIRGKGVGRALIEAVYAAAAQHGADRVYWMTHETNETAMRLYDTMAERSEFLGHRKMLT